MAFELVGGRFLTTFPTVEEAPQPRALLRAEKRRAEERSPIEVPLVVCGLNSNGRLFFELAHIEDLSRTGCRIHLRTKPQSDSPLAVRVADDKGVTRQEIAQILFQVAWIHPEAEGWAVGAYSLGSKDLRTLVFLRQTT